MQRNIHLERQYPHPPERVWRAITDPTLIKRWMQMDNDFKAEVGHRFELRDISGNWDGILACEVIAVEAPQRLAYNFIGGVMKHTTVVTITLEATANGTKLNLDHTGFSGLQDIGLSFIVGLGWRRMLKDIQAVLTDTSIESA